MADHLALVLLHFFGSSHAEWELVAKSFVTHRRVIAFDLPGFGDAASLGSADVASMVTFLDERIVEAGAPLA